MRACSSSLRTVFRGTEIDKTRIEYGVNVFVKKIADMSVGKLHREACLREDTLETEVHNLSVCLWRDFNFEPEFPEQYAEKRKIIMEEK